MSNIIQHTVFQEFGMNSDDDLRYINENSCVENRNILIGEDGSNGTITNMKGADAITVPENYPDYMGSCYDSESRCAYWFGYDVNTTHCSLFRYNVDTGTVTRIFEDTGEYFGIDADYKMKDVKYLDGRIYFNPRTSEPKVIDINMALYYTTYSAWSNSTIYTAGNKVRFYGGVFNCLSTTTAGQSPSTTPAKWERLYDCYDDSNSQLLTAFNIIKVPPTSIASATYESDTTIGYNNIRTNLFRFSYRYRYYDDAYSVFSSYSELVLPINEEAYDGEILNDITANNCISLSIYGGSAAIIKEIDVIYQEFDGDWKKITTINRREQTTIADSFITVKFYNDRTYEAITNALVDIIYDAVPRTANCQELISKNRILYARVKEGFDNLDKEDLEVALTPDLNEIVIGSSGGTLRRDNVVSGDLYTASEWDTLELAYNYYHIVKIGAWFPGTVVAGDYYEITVSGYNYTKLLTSGDVATEQALTNTIAGVIIFPPGWTEVRLVSGHYELWIGSRTIVPNITLSKFYTAGSGVLQTKKRGFKTGARQPFCIYYYDASMRRGDAQVCDDLSVYVPMLTETSPLVTTMNYRYDINWSVGHLPPSWAKYWRFGFAGNSLCTEFVQYVISNYSSSDSSFDNRGTIDITPLQTIKTTTTANWNQFPNSIIDPYVWEYGDRVRIITRRLSGEIDGVTDYSGTVAGTIRINCGLGHTLETGAVIVIDSGTYAGTYTITKIDAYYFYVTATYIANTTGTWRCTSGYMLGDIYDYEISSYDATTNKLILQHGITFPSMGKQSLVEIYRPAKINDKTIYYEYGAILPIIKDTLGVSVHGGTTTNQDTNTSVHATGTFTGGDVFHIMRTPDKPFNETVGFTHIGMIHESQWYSDFYMSDDWSKGKIGFESTIGEKILNWIRFSNTYIQGTRVNGLSTFDALNYKEINDIYGDIYRIIESGDTLKVYQANKCSSVFIGRTEYTDTSGNTTVATSNNVLGSVNYSFTKYGTVNPESLIKNNRFVYGFDIYNGVVWRDTANGIFPISGRFETADGIGDYKVETYFKAKAKALLVSGLDHTSVHSVWDEEYKMLYVIFSDILTPANNAAIAFHEPSNRWISLYDFICYDGYTYSTSVWEQSLDMGWLMFGKNASGDSVWKMNSNTASNRCKFFGTKQNCVVGIAANKNGGVMKTFDSIFIHSDGKWSGTVTIPANLNQPYGMYSILPLAKFEKREGKLMSEFMRNGKTNSSSASVLDYLNGETLRGYAADIRLTNTDTSKVSMFMVDVNMTKSDV